MRLTKDKVREFGSEVILHKRALYPNFVEAHKEINNQNMSAIKIVGEYNFLSGQEYAYLKILNHLEAKRPKSKVKETEG